MKNLFSSLNDDVLSEVSESSVPVECIGCDKACWLHCDKIPNAKRRKDEKLENGDWVVTEH